MRKQNNTLYCGEFEITKREVGASVTLVAILLIIGILIGNGINNKIEDRNLKYNQAIQINDDKDLFEYGMRTNVGNAFIYGTLQAVDTVTYPELGGEYMYIEKVKEKYTKHTRQVAHTRTVNGKSQTYYTTETYWTWDRVSSEDLKCKEISFCGVTFNSNKINIPSAIYIDTIKESSHIRYKYYGTGVEHVGTIFTELKDNTISDNLNFYENNNIDKTLECFTSNSDICLFWFFWIILTICCVFGFVYLDNKWLEG